MLTASAGVWLMFQIHSCIYHPADPPFVFSTNLLVFVLLTGQQDRDSV